MDLSEKDSGSSSEDNDKLVKVFNNARVPEDSEDEDAIGESSQEEANVEPEVEAKSEAEVDAESEVDEGSEAETAVVTDKEVEQVEPKITKSSGYKRHAYRDIILECFNHYANETISLAKIKSYAHSVHEVRGDYQENVLKAALRRLLKEEVVKNLKGIGLSGSFKLAPQKPGKVKKNTKPKIIQSGGKMKVAKITADVYGSSTNAQPKQKTVKKVGEKKNNNNKEGFEENVDPPMKKGKAGPKKDTVAKKPKEVTKKPEKSTTKPEKATTKPKEATEKPKVATEKPKKAIKRGVSKKEEEPSQDDENEDVPKKIRKPGPKKIVAPKAPKEAAAKKTTVSKKVPSKTTVVAVRKSLDSDKKKVAAARPKKK